MSSKKLGFFNNLSKPFVKLVENFYPDAFIFVIVLSVLTFLSRFQYRLSIIETLGTGTGLPKLFTLQHKFA